MRRARKVAAPVNTKLQRQKETKSSKCSDKINPSHSFPTAFHLKMITLESERSKDELRLAQLTGNTVRIEEKLGTLQLRK